MFGFKKKQHDNTTPTDQQSSSVKKTSLFGRLTQGLSKTRQGFSQGVGQLFKRSPKLDDDFLEELETLLLTADVGIEATEHLLEGLKLEAKKQKVAQGDALLDILKAQMVDILTSDAQPLNTQNNKPFILLMVGVNGAGKTTTIGKLAKQLQAQGQSVMLAAGDTFRAAAVEQLQEWGERNAIPVISQQSGSDSASVIYDAVAAATARKVDVLIADTAGRLHTQKGLMAELEKVKRVIQKHDDTAPHEIMLVLDASIGQNALQQAKQFNEVVAVSGITMTKLDGTAKGGILFAIAKHLQIPIRFIGIGEGIDDLRPFNAQEFVDAIFTNE